MLTIAVWGFSFATQFAGTALYLAYRTNNPDLLNNVAAICGLILAPTLGAYVGRKITTPPTEVPIEKPAISSSSSPLD